MFDKRLVFDTIPELFDKWRVRYSQELFDHIVEECRLNREKKCLEIGPGTGQATEFALETGCDYCAIELGSHLAELLKKKYDTYENFQVINADFEVYPFASGQFDLVYSAAAIQWIKEETAYKKCYSILKEHGYLAMCYMIGDYRTDNPALCEDIGQIYDTYFVSEMPYRQKFNYEAGETYGFRYLGRKDFHGKRSYSAEEYIEYIKTHSDHITLKEECRDPFFQGIRDAILKHGNKIRFQDTYVLHLYQK